MDQPSIDRKNFARLPRKGRGRAGTGFGLNDAGCQLNDLGRQFGGRGSAMILEGRGFAHIREQLKRGSRVPYSVSPSIQPICTRRCFTMTDMI